MNTSHSTLQVLPENSDSDQFNVNYIQYLFDETFNQLHEDQPDTLAHLQFNYRNGGELQEFSGTLNYKRRENSYFCNRTLLKSRTYNYELFRHELQIPPSKFHSIAYHQNIPSVETFLRLMAVAGIRNIQDIYPGGEFIVTRPEFENAAYNFITLKQVHKNIKARFQEYQTPIQKIAAKGYISRPTLYKILSSLDETVSMRTLINFCLSTDTPLEDMINIERYQAAIPLEII